MRINKKTDPERTGHHGRLVPPIHDVSAFIRVIESVDNAPERRRSKLAKLLNVSVSQVVLWEKGVTSITAERAVMMEAITQGEVTRQELRPDLYRKLTREDYEMGIKQ